MPEKTFKSHSEADLLSISKNILNTCNTVRIFAFYGDLGAGKTTLIKACCVVLGVEESVTSPTFAIVHEYEGEAHLIYHFDFYRIKSETEAYDIGYDEYFYSGEYCFIEWPERIPTLLPANAAHIHIEVIDDTTRKFHLTY